LIDDYKEEEAIWELTKAICNLLLRRGMEREVKEAQSSKQKASDGGI
jgi:hypothetical protein